MTAQERVTGYAGKGIAVIAAVAFLFDIFTGGSLSELSRVFIMAIAAVAYLSVFIRQCQIAYEYEGAPVTLPLAFRWVVAQFFGVTGLLILWFLLVAILPVYNATISSVMWSLFAISTLFFFGRWLAIGRPQIAGPGETGASR